MDDIAGVVLVLLPQVLEDPDLLLGLPVEPLLVPHHLEGDVLVGLVVVHLEHLAKRALAYHLQDLIPVGGKEIIFSFAPQEYSPLTGLMMN